MNIVNTHKLKTSLFGIFFILLLFPLLATGSTLKTKENKTWILTSNATIHSSPRKEISTPILFEDAR